MLPFLPRPMIPPRRAVRSAARQRNLTPRLEALERRLALASFSGLGDLAGGEFHSGATDVSADGLVVVGGSRSALGSEAFRWTVDDGMVGLGDLPGGGFFSSANAVSADGTVVVGLGRTNSPANRPFRWTVEAGMTAIGEVDSGGSAYGVSADGTVVVGQYDGEAFRWTHDDGIRNLGELEGGRYARDAFGVSSDGMVIVGVGASTGALRWTRETGLVDIGGGTPFATSADGSVVVGRSLRWTSNEGLVGYEEGPGGLRVHEARDVSADGSTIVGIGYRDATREHEAFIWNPSSGTQSLKQLLVNSGASVHRWKLIGAQGISGDGTTIVGYGTNPDGYQEAWIARLDPPPSPPNLSVNSNITTSTLR